jgi:hypothetical protein
VFHPRILRRAPVVYKRGMKVCINGQRVPID